MITDIKANVNQIPIDVLTEGAKDYPAMSKLGQLFTAGWKSRLVEAGYVYRLPFGTVTGGADITLVGTGTVMDLDIPSGVVALDSGWLIPMSLNLGVASLADAASDEVDILLTSDRATAVSAADIATSTAGAEACHNLLDGAAAFGGRVAAVCTVAITDPVSTDILYYSRIMAMGTAVNTLIPAIDKEWDYPPAILAGPCSLLLYVYGTIATTFAGSLVFAAVPTSFFPVV